MKGKIIQNYKILSKIGEGGMGSVYLAEHIHLNRKAALKFIHPDISSNSALIERFKNEARVQGKISHPNIVETYDFLQEGRTFVIVMEYAEGVTLKEYIKQKGKLSEVEALTIFKEIIDGIKHAHSKGIIHRDIKPSNIILGSNNRIKVMDFGIAKLAGDSQLTKTGEKIGTPYFMSPEQVVGNKEIDNRSDLYTLGVNLYLMLTGQMPYDTTKGDFTLELQIVKTPFPNITKIVPSISKNTVNIISKLTNKEPTDRYQNCEECLSDVQHSIDMLKSSELKKKTPGINEKLSSLIKSVKNKKIKTDKVKSFASEIIGKKYFYPALISVIVILILSGFFIFKNDIINDTNDNLTDVDNSSTDAVSTKTEKIDIASADQIFNEYLTSLYDKKADIKGNGNVKINNDFRFEASDKVKSNKNFDIQKYNPFNSEKFSKSNVNLKLSGLSGSNLENKLYSSSYSVSDENWKIDALLKADVSNKPLLLKYIMYKNISNISKNKQEKKYKTSKKRKRKERKTSYERPKKTVKKPPTKVDIK